MKTLYLIDGHAQFYRAFHAVRTPMSSPITGEPTNMTFGFVGMLLKLLAAREPNLARRPPDYLAVAIDVSGDRGLLRAQVYPPYKATRPEPPELIRPQIERCVWILRELGVPVLGAEGYEADDVIATVARRLRRRYPDLLIRIVGRDKDLKQLLESPGPDGGAIEMYDVHTDTILDERTFREQTGLTPQQWTDALALMGDASDNVPGVEGVGEKIAAELIRRYGSLDRLLAQAEDVPGKRGEALRQAGTTLALSRQLVTLRDDLPVSLDLDQADTRRLALHKLPAICRELGFNRYRDEVAALLEQGVGYAARGESQPEGGTAPFSPQPPAPPLEAQPMLFPHAARVEGTRPVPGRYECVRTVEQLEQVVAEIRRRGAVAVDTEATSLAPLQAKLCGVALAVEPGQAWYIPVRSPSPREHLDEATVLARLRPALEDPAVAKVGHNLKYDMLVLRRAGVELQGLCRPPPDPGTGPTWREQERPDESVGRPRNGARNSEAQAITWPGCDSMVASYLIDPSRSSHAQDALALALLGREGIPITDLIGRGRQQRTFDRVPLDQATPYAAEDADIALQLRDRMLPELARLGLGELWERVELPLVEVLAELEWNGIMVDAEELDRQRQRLETRVRDLAREIEAAAHKALGRSFNPDSPRQLASILFNKPTDPQPGLGLRATKRTKTGRSTDTEVLERLAAEAATPIPRLILEYRQLTKLVNTYLVALREAINPETGRVHASFNQTVAATGRLSSSDPNLQNIPIRTDVGRDIRRAFVAPPGRVLITADYSQIELRLLAHLSRDAALIDAFTHGEDIHTAVAAQIYGVAPDQVTREQRNTAKMVNFGIVYGITPGGLARRLGVSERDAADIIASYRARYAGIAAFLEACIEQARRSGYAQTMLRRRRPIPGIGSRNAGERALAERMAINSVVQGSAADLIKIAMVDLHARLSERAAYWRAGRAPAVPGVKMLLQIHDELVFEAPQEHAEAARQLIVERMERAMALAVPLKVASRIGQNWYEGE